MKKLKFLMVLLCFSFMICGCEKQVEEEPKVQSTPLLLEVTKEGVDHKLYLFGSIHAADTSLYPLPDYVMEAYENSHVLAVEFDLVEYMKDLSRQMADLKQFINPDGTVITDYVSDEVYNKAVDILTRTGLYSSMFDYYSPIMWYTLLDNAVIADVGLGTAYGIDQHFLQLAKEDGKNIMELESSDSQYAMLTGFDYDTQVYLLELGVRDYEISKHSMSRLYELYKKGNRDDLEEVVFFDSGITNSYIEEYNNQLITVRNQNMARSLEQAFLEGKNIFCTVGLAHIIGEDGLAERFSQNGYTVTVLQ